MSEITRGVIGMPFELAMESDLCRRQFHARAQALLAEVGQLKAENAQLKNQEIELKAENEALRKHLPSPEIVWCACGDGYPVHSYGAGFMDANEGSCMNCDAAVRREADNG